MTNKLKRNQQQGFLLIEVLVAIVLITVAVVPIVGMFIQSTRANSNASQITAATNLSQEQLDLLKSWPPATWASYIPATTSPSVDISTASPLGASPIAVPPSNVNYTIVTTVSPCAEDNVHLVQVTVRTSWSAGMGGSVFITAFYPKI
jgi:Tfp pilus assembly protein PilV